MNILVAYKGLCESDREVKGMQERFSFLDVIENHRRYIYEPLKKLGEVKFAMCGNESETIKRATEILKPVYVSREGHDQLERTVRLLENVPEGITHIVVLRFDMVFKCKVTECHIEWDAFNFPWWEILSRERFVMNGDTFFIFPSQMKEHVRRCCERLHAKFKRSDLKCPHLHGFYRRCMRGTPYKVNMMMSGRYDSNTCSTQNPLFNLYRSIGRKVPLNDAVRAAIRRIQRIDNTIPGRKKSLCVKDVRDGVKATMRAKQG